MTEVRPLRSVIFVPGNRERWIASSDSLGADGVIYDLVDSVPASEVTRARDLVQAKVENGVGSEVARLVRVGAAGTDRIRADLDAVIRPGTAGIVLPHVRSPDDVRAVDALLSSAEDQQGMVQGATVLLPLIETAEAFRLSYEIATASPRVAYMGGATARSGDIARAIGFRWSPEGHETLFLRSWTLMNVRAAGVPFPITGMWSDVQDIEGLQKFANHSRDLGYAGMMVIHPSHISTVNEVFSPSPEEIDYLCRLMAALEEASSEGRGAVNFEGEMVDAAHARTAALELDLARRLGLWTPTA